MLTGPRSMDAPTLEGGPSLDALLSEYRLDGYLMQLTDAGLGHVRDLLILDDALIDRIGIPILARKKLRALAADFRQGLGDAIPLGTPSADRFRSVATQTYRSGRKECEEEPNGLIITGLPGDVSGREVATLVGATTSECVTLRRTEDGATAVVHLNGSDAELAARCGCNQGTLKDYPITVTLMKEPDHGGSGPSHSATGALADWARLHRDGDAGLEGGAGDTVKASGPPSMGHRRAPKGARRTDSERVWVPNVRD